MKNPFKKRDNANSSFIPKLDAVEKYCKSKGYKFEFWTEKKKSM